MALLLVTTGCSTLFFHPSRDMQEGPAVKLFKHHDVMFVSSDGVPIHGWYFPVENARGSILVLHGNAQNLSTHVNSVLWLVKEGYNLFIIDYRGYGWSGGEPELEGVHRDADAALEKLFAMPETDPDRVVVLGQSLGGSIAVYTVAHSPHKDRIRALVIDSAFSSYRLIAREKLDNFWLTWPFQYPLSWTINNDYSAEKWIGQVSPMPVLILHGLVRSSRSVASRHDAEPGRAPAEGALAHDDSRPCPVLWRRDSAKEFSGLSLPRAASEERCPQRPRKGLDKKGEMSFNHITVPNSLNSGKEAL